MSATDALRIRMREDELVARIRYHEDCLREAERRVAFHRAAAEAARTELDALRQPVQTRPHLTAA